MPVRDDVRAMLGLAVDEVASRPEECARSPGRDFARGRKLPLHELLWLIVTMGTDTLGMELLRDSGMSAGAPTVGALSQQWSKLNDEAMPRLHAAFLSMFEPVPAMGRFWLLACDGTELAMAPDAADAETRMPPARGGRGRNSVHLTCSYDVERGVFCDMVCQGGRSQDEHDAAESPSARGSAPSPSASCAPTTRPARSSPACSMPWDLPDAPCRDSYCPMETAAYLRLFGHRGHW